MSDIPINEPTVLTAGSTWQWRKTLAGYSPADNWVLTYYLRSSKGAINVVADTDPELSDTFLVNVAAAATANYDAGEYTWFAFVSKSTDRFDVGRGKLTIKANPASLGAVDLRSHARKALDAVNAVIENRASQEEMNYSISDAGMSRSVGLMSLAELIKFKSYYEQLVAQEEAAEALSSGGLPKNKIKVRFVR